MPIIASRAGGSASGFGGLRTFGAAAAIDTGAMFPLGMVQVGSGGSPSITFSSIPSTYKHLQIRALVTGTNATQTGSTSFQLNGDTGSNYTRHILGGGGATAFAYAATVETKGHVYGYNDNLNNVVPMSFVMDILDYANTSKYKTTRVFSGSDRNGTAPHGDINLISSLWLNTNAITSLSIFIGGQDIGQYSSFALYGIKGA